MVLRPIVCSHVRSFSLVGYWSCKAISNHNQPTTTSEQHQSRGLFEPPYTISTLRFSIANTVYSDFLFPPKVHPSTSPRRKSCLLRAFIAWALDGPWSKPCLNTACHSIIYPGSIKAAQTFPSPSFSPALSLRNHQAIWDSQNQNAISITWMLFNISSDFPHIQIFSRPQNPQSKR